MSVDLGRRITRWLRFKGMTQVELAGRLRVSPAAVTGWVRGKKTPGYVTLRRIAKAFGTDLEGFFGRPPE